MNEGYRTGLITFEQFFRDVTSSSSLEGGDTYGLLFSALEFHSPLDSGTILIAHEIEKGGVPF